MDLARYDVPSELSSVLRASPSGDILVSANSTITSFTPHGDVVQQWMGLLQSDRFSYIADVVVLPDGQVPALVALQPEPAGTKRFETQMVPRTRS